MFYSNTPGSGNRMHYHVMLPHDPAPRNPTAKSYHFELNGAMWFGMALCDTQSYPEQISTCTPDSDSNIVDPAVSPNHPGTAFMELQFYPPGWIAWPTWAVAVGADTCNPTRWCAAMNVFSVLEDPVADDAERYVRGPGGPRALQLRVRHQERRLPGAGEPDRFDADDVHARPGEDPVHERRRPGLG